jgi:hypothetical protein
MNGENYKILAGMLALQRFTVDELTHYTDAKASTVRSVIGRLKDLVNGTGSLSSDKPGGREKIYELKKEGAHQIEKHLGDLFESLKVVQTQKSPPEVQTKNPSPEVPIGLRTAEDAIIKGDLEVTSKDARQILEIAKIDLVGAKAEIEELAAAYGDCEAIWEMRARSERVENKLAIFDAVGEMGKLQGELEAEIEGMVSACAECEAIAEMRTRSETSEDAPAAAVGEMGGLLSELEMLKDHSPIPQVVWTTGKMLRVSEKIATLVVATEKSRRPAQSLSHKLSVFFDARLVELKNRVQEACMPFDVPQFRFGDVSMENALGKIASEHTPSGVCLLINSKNDTAQVYNFLNLLANSVDRLYVFDIDFDDGLRNDVLGSKAYYGRACYVGRAGKLDANAIRGTFGFVSKRVGAAAC